MNLEKYFKNIEELELFLNNHQEGIVIIRIGKSTDKYIVYDSELNILFSIELQVEPGDDIKQEILEEYQTEECERVHSIIEYKSIKELISTIKKQREDIRVMLGNFICKFDMSLTDVNIEFNDFFVII